MHETGRYFVENGPVSTYFGRNVLDLEKMKDYMSCQAGVNGSGKHCTRDVKDMMDKVRHSADELEMLIDDEMWPLPKYRELLFF